MKKLIAILLAVLTLGSASALAQVSDTNQSSAAIDLSGMSYDELVALKDQINLAMWESEDWQEVTVPQGVYEVGADIPAGHWTIKASETDSYASAYIKCGKTLDETKKDLEWDDYYVSESLVNEKSKGYNETTDKTETDLELEKGMYVVVEYSSVVFTPYSGKPSLGFK